MATYGRHCLVETPEGRRLICHPRGKKNQVVVGDQVFWQIAGDEGSIEKLRDRRNLFYRQDEIRTKSFAANLDRVLILIAADPEYSESQLSRALVAAEAERITPIIALNKSDLAQPFAQAWERLSPYRAMGYSVMPVSLNPRSAVADDGVQALCEQLKGLTTLVLGPSGTGKSTLINRLVPDAQVETGEISLALNSGKHTTTSTRWYWVPSLDGPNDGSHDKGSDTRSDNRGESGTADSDTSGGFKCWRCAQNSADRFARFSRIWLAPHRTYALGRLHARFACPCGELQVLQLHAPARARVRGVGAGGERHSGGHHQRASPPHLCAVVRRVEPTTLVSQQLIPSNWPW